MKYVALVLIMTFSTFVMGSVSQYVSYSLKVDKVSKSKLFFTNSKGKKFFIPREVIAGQVANLDSKTGKKITFQVTWADRRKMLSQVQIKMGIEGDSGW